MTPLKREPRSASPDYFKGREHLVYYSYIDLLVRGFGANARSVIDVGSANTPYIEKFDWIPDRVCLDFRHPYESENVKGIKADFLTFCPEAPYDLALCFQVLEHIARAEEFAAKLMSIANAVLVSVPYKWPPDPASDHVHDPVDLAKVTSWFGRDPDFQMVVTEPFGGKKGRRLFCYYHVRGPQLGRSDWSRNLRRSFLPRA
jgi:hypothetical protein